jgi:hypothetical protein
MVLITYVRRIGNTSSAQKGMAPEKSVIAAIEQ